MVNRVAPWEKLVNGGAPFNMSTELASGVAPLANGENGGRRGTVPEYGPKRANRLARENIQLSQRIWLAQMKEFG